MRPFLLTLGLAVLASTAWASPQEPATPVLSGVVTVGDENRPLEGATVVLHRVDAVEAGEIDSVRSGSGGAFRFTLPTVPDPGGRSEVYFASVRHEGILYFGPPVTTAVSLDSTYALQVFETVVAPTNGAALPLAVRYILLEQGADGWMATDLFQVEVTGDRTWVPADSGVTWGHLLPAGIRNVEAGGSDIPPDAARVKAGRLEVSAPLTPGLRQIVIRYALDSLGTSIPLPGGVGEMEILVRQPAPTLDVSGLRTEAGVTLEDGAEYQRYVGADLAPGAVVRLREAPEPFVLPVRWVAVLLGLLLAGGGVWAWSRRAAPASGRERPAPGAGPSVATREELIRRIATLDLQAEETSDPELRARLREQREALLRQVRGFGG